jgi:type IX secretion system PorP/SprF family membrane protein
MKYLYVFCLLILGVSNKVLAQDIHWSQWYHIGAAANPAEAGMFDGDHRFGGAFRQQWNQVPVPYRTLWLGADTKTKWIKNQRAGIGAGLNLLLDKAGDSKMTALHVRMPLSAKIALAEHWAMSVGIEPGVIQRRFETDALTFDNQFNGDIFDPNASKGESSLLANTQLLVFDLATGGTIYWQNNKGWAMNLGGSASHLTRPQWAFDAADDVVLPLHWMGNVAITIPFGSRVSLQPSAIYKGQTTYRELVAGSLLRTVLDNRIGRNTTLLLGGYWRSADALIAMFGVEYVQWRAALSYDINTSDLQIATNRQGGPEVTVQYIIKSVSDLKRSKACPVF